MRDISSFVRSILGNGMPRVKTRCLKCGTELPGQRDKTVFCSQPACRAMEWGDTLPVEADDLEGLG